MECWLHHLGSRPWSTPSPTHVPVHGRDELRADPNDCAIASCRVLRAYMGAPRPEQHLDGFLALAAPPALYHCPHRGIFLTQAPHCDAPGLVAVGDWETSRRARSPFQPDLMFLD